MLQASYLGVFSFKREEGIFHVATSPSVSGTYLPIHHPMWEVLIAEKEYDCKQWGSLISETVQPMCALSNVPFLYISMSLFYKNTSTYCPADPES